MWVFNWNGDVANKDPNGIACGVAATAVQNESVVAFHASEATNRIYSQEWGEGEGRRYRPMRCVCVCEWCEERREKRAVGSYSVEGGTWELNVVQYIDAEGSSSGYTPGIRGPFSS